MSLTVPRYATRRHARRIRRARPSSTSRMVRAANLAGDAPEPRAVQRPELGEVVEVPEVGGLHHRYERTAA